LTVAGWTLRRRGLIAAAAVLLVGLAVLGAMRLLARHPVQGAEAVVAPTQLAEQPPPESAGSSAPVGSMASEAAAAPDPSAESAARAAPVCGPGLEGPGAAASKSQGSLETQDRLVPVQDTEQALGRLQRQSAVHALAAAALRASLQVEQDAGATKPATCERGDERCRLGSQQRHQDLVQTAYGKAADEGRDLALRSGEPAAYQLALHLCAALPLPQRPACSDPLLRAWVVREADNATPWLMLAAAEREQGDHQAADEALYRASQAPRISDASRALWGVMGETAFAPEAGAVAAGLQPRWAALIAGMNYTSLGHVSGLCSDAVLGDGNLRQRCDALAQRMVSQGGSLIHRVEGLAIAHRLGWPEERLASLRAHVSALLKQDSSELAAQTALSPCDAVRTHRDRAQQVAAQGEVARLEERLRSSARQSRSP
jgi:hypothetical protein